MGVGMFLAVSPDEADGMVTRLREAGEDAWVAGEIAAGDSKVVLD